MVSGQMGDQIPYYYTVSLYFVWVNQSFQHFYNCLKYVKYVAIGSSVYSYCGWIVII